MGWKTLRLIYSLALAGVVYLVNPGVLDEPMAIVEAVLLVIAGNIVFFAGPMLELLLKGLGMTHKAVRYVLFLVIMAGAGYAAYTIAGKLPMFLGNGG